MDDLDLGLLTRARAGDDESFEILLKEYEKYIYMNTKGYYLVDGEREDLIQEGIIGFLKGIKNYNPEKEASFKTFVILCMRRQIITALKTSNAKKNKFVNGLNNNMEENNYYMEPENSPSAEEILIYKELIEEFREYTNHHLSNLEKEVLTYLVQGYTYAEIAKILDKPNKVIDNAYQRIRNKVRKWFEQSKST